MFNQIQFSDKSLLQDHSLTAQEFLLSPSYHKFKSPQQFDLMKQNTLDQYIYPTEIINNSTKTYNKKFKQHTQPDLDRISNKSKISKNSRHSNIENIVQNLQSAIKKKDAKIKQLQKSLQELSSFPKNTQITIATTQSPHFDKDLLYTLRDKKQSPRKQPQNLGNNQILLELQIKKHQKQIKFLTTNNKQLYQQLITTQQYCHQIKQTLSKTIQYTHQLEQKLLETSHKNNGLSTLNKTLLKQQKNMIRNYQEQLIIFNKMHKNYLQNKKSSKSLQKVNINNYLQKYANLK